MRQYVFEVIVEPDEDRWHAYCPALESQGAATWGGSRDEAIAHIREVVQMVVEELVADGIPVPDNTQNAVYVSRIAIAV